MRSPIWWRSGWLAAFPRTNLPGSPGGLVIDREQLPGELFGHTRLGIAGIELTQSVQHHGAAGPSYGTDNSVPPVALKPLLARVYPYVRAAMLGADALSGARVTGELVLSVGNHVVYRTGPTRADGARSGRRIVSIVASGTWTSTCPRAVRPRWRSNCFISTRRSISSSRRGIAAAGDIISPCESGASRAERSRARPRRGRNTFSFSTCRRRASASCA